MNGIYYTSDLHLGHKHVLSTRGQFKNIEEHDEFLIERWNRKLTKKDEIWILGDLSYRSAFPISYYLDRMKGRKHLIIGNHDAYWMKGEELSRYFETVETMRTIRFDKKKVTLCHYPMLEWLGSRYVESGTSFLIHGHIHATKDSGTYDYIRRCLPHAMNASVDINGFEPVSFEELVENNREWYGR